MKMLIETVSKESENIWTLKLQHKPNGKESETKEN